MYFLNYLFELIYHVLYNLFIKGFIVKNFILTILLILCCNMFYSSALADTVVFNTSTHRIHSPNCKCAKNCTVNCIKIDRVDAINRGGIPCKVCKAKAKTSH